VSDLNFILHVLFAKPHKKTDLRCSHKHPELSNSLLCIMILTPKKEESDILSGKVNPSDSGGEQYWMRDIIYA